MNTNFLGKKLNIKKAIFLLGVFLLILISRMFCLTHEMQNHPDEKVFVQASSSIADVLLHPGSEYSEVKEYPEGAYFFFAPFQIVADIIETVTGTEQNLQLWNRIASIFYFAAGGVIGCLILLEFFKNIPATIIYVLMLIFSVIHIEQSRYGTGESMSFAVLMTVIYFSGKWLMGKPDKYIYAACLFVGFLAAIKYPQLYFILIPFGAFLVNINRKKNKILLFVSVCAVVTIFGFLLISPGVVKNIRYIARVCRLELSAYVSAGNVTEIGGTINHIFSVLVYWMLYSDILFAPIFFGMGIFNRKVFKEAMEESTKQLHRFLKYVLPVAVLGFLIYNIFVTTLFMRTLYPFFGVALLYAASGLSCIIKDKKVFAYAIIAILILRGGLMIAAYVPQNRKESFADKIQETIIQTNAEKVLGIALDTYATGGSKWVLAAVDSNIGMNNLRTEDFPQIEKGTVVITGPLEFGKAMGYPFPVEDQRVKKLIDGWNSFKKEYKNYLVGYSYPESYGYLFGYWIKGTTTGEYDFPTHYIYAVT